MNLDQKIEREIRILREYEPPEGYYLAFSGGKDSQVCEHLLRMSGVKYDSHYNSTTIDAPDLMKFIRKDYPETNWHYPIYMKKPTNFYQLITRKGLPSRKFRWCCQVFKEGGGYGRLMIDGVRAAESPNRAKRQKFEYFLNKYYHAKFKDQEVPPEQLEKLLAKNRAKQITIDFINEPVAPKLFSFGHAKPHLPGEEPEIDIRYDGKSTGETFKTAKTEPK